MDTLQEVSRFVVIMNKGFVERGKKTTTKDMIPSFVTWAIFLISLCLRFSLTKWSNTC